MLTDSSQDIARLKQEWVKEESNSYGQIRTKTRAKNIIDCMKMLRIEQQTCKKS